MTVKELKDVLANEDKNMEVFIQNAVKALTWVQK